KTTELKRLLALFDKKETLGVFVQFGAQESISHPMLVGTMAARLMSELEAPSEMTNRAFESLRSWFYKEEHSILTQEDKKGSAEVGGKIPMLKASKGVAHATQKVTKRTRETNRDLETLIERFNLLINSVRKHSGRRLVFVVDDIDKIQNMDSIQSA